MKYITVVFALIIMVLSQSLLAHTKLNSSNPADGAAIVELTEIRLEFSTEAKLTALKLENDAGTEMALGPIPVDTAAIYSIAVTEPLAPGNYVVTWRSVSGDAHIVSGEIHFSVTD
jgi:methionine-rich copper-binding protein CopC